MLECHSRKGDIYLIRSETLHVGRANQMVEIFVEVADIRVDRDLVLPFKLRPHLTELSVRTTRRHDVVHDVNVDVIENDTVTVAGGTRDVINCKDRAHHIRQG